MSEQMIIEQCSPTLAGLKTANLFSCKYECKEGLWKDIRKFNRKLSYKGIKMLPIRVEKHFALIYLYRPKKLEEDLNNELCEQILRNNGYVSTNVNKCIVELVHRMKTCAEFPHEIGLFLGYPPEDVKGFIEHKKEGCKCVGCWKVYDNEERAKQCFESFKRCTRIYKEMFARGKTIERLTVAV